MSKKCPSVIIVDYGMGNLFSIQRMVDYLGGKAQISADPAVISSAEHLILPGVGAFGDGMKNLRERGLIEPLKKYSRSGKALLGICLGMQLVMTESEEFGRYVGLDLVKGKVRHFPGPSPQGPHYKIPHAGWASLNIPPDFKNNGGSEHWKNTILDKVSEGSFVYFVHSYFVIPDAPQAVLAQTDYGDTKFCSAVSWDNLFGCQFHPEISGEVGLKIMREFLFNF